jgi:hypothetical protein
VTALEEGRPIRRTVAGLCVMLTPEGIYTREPRRREWYGPVAWSHVHLIGARGKADENVIARKTRKVSRGLLK